MCVGGRWTAVVVLVVVVVVVVVVAVVIAAAVAVAVWLQGIDFSQLQSVKGQAAVLYVPIHFRVCEKYKRREYLPWCTSYA